MTGHFYTFLHAKIRFLDPSNPSNRWTLATSWISIVKCADHWKECYLRNFPLAFSPILNLVFVTRRKSRQRLVGSGRSEIRSSELNMAYQFSRKGCFKCGNLGHIAENCSSEQRLCYNCRQPGHESSACPSPRTVSAKQCYSCGGVGHIQAECPTLRVQQQGANQKCYNCGRFGHFARNCQNGATSNSGFASRAPPPGRALNTSTLPPVKCYRCGGPNHLARDCLAAPSTIMNDSIPTGPAAANANKVKTCYKCQQEGHIARECPETTEFVN